MDELQYGDRVRVKDGDVSDAFSTVYFFGHRNANQVAKYVRVELEDGAELEVSPLHYVYVDGGAKQVQAGHVRVGDMMLNAEGHARAVRRVEHKELVGVFNPHTEHGDIYVNKIKASSYTALVPPQMAHLLLTPMRVLFSVFQSEMAGRAFHQDTPAWLVPLITISGSSS